MEIICIIPARGGSKAIPRKNVRWLAGKPLIAHTIEQAQRTHSINRLVISTDDPEIAEVAQRYGTEVIWRPTEISGDAASSESALSYTLEYLRKNEGYEPGLVVFLQATSPSRQLGDIDNAIELLYKYQADSVFSGCPVHGFIWRSDNQGLVPVDYDPTHRHRRQELNEVIIEENGSIYVFKPWVLEKYKSRLGGKIAAYMMPRIDSFQIDEPNDLELMERIIAIRDVQLLKTKNLATVRLLVLDFDGVMTDNRVLLNQDGTESVFCNRGDGWGIARLKESGVDVVVISTEVNPVVTARCKKLGIECVQGCNNKLETLKAISKKRVFNPEQVAYLGNDVNDLSCLIWVGISIAVADAEPEVSAIAKLRTTRTGGAGAVREVCDWILSSKRCTDKENK